MLALTLPQFDAAVQKLPLISARALKQARHNDDARLAAPHRRDARRAPEQRLGAAAVTPSGRELHRLRGRRARRAPARAERRYRVLRRHGPSDKGRKKQKKKKRRRRKKKKMWLLHRMI